MANKDFLVSVANAIIRDPNTGAGIAYGTANIDSALTISTQATEVRGGINNPLLFTYIHDRKVDVKITQATFDTNILALNAGTSVLNGAVSVVGTDCLVLSASGSGTLTNSPLGSVEVFLSNGTVQTVTPVGSVITVSGGANDRVTAIYDYTATADQITIETTKPPSVVDLTLKAEVRDDTNTIVNYLQISIPRFQINGNYTLSLAANGVSNQALEGTSLSVASSDCNTGEYYAKATWIPATNTAPSIYALALYPDLTFSVAAGLPKSKQLHLDGLRGGLYSNVDLTTSASYAVTSGSTTLAAYVNVGAHTGLVTAGSSVGVGWTGTITASYIDATAGLLHDYITFTITA